ncbi:MAG: MerR family transcriptional regulator [Lachnospiraceae bacterium]|nr:MerR family transcriptional regulator [Lachnospiraceae bacterium]
MKIKQVEELVGITRKNIRFYEEQELLTVGRSENGYREYGLEDVKRLKQIRLLRRLAVPIEEIKQLFDGKRVLEDILERQLAALDRQKESIRKTQLFCRQLLEEAHTLETLDADTCLEQMDKLEKEGVRFMNEKHQDIRRRKQRGALLGAGIMTIMMLALIGVMLWGNSVDPLPIGMLLFFIGIPILIIIGVWVAMTGRIKEIEGGEEDEASKY